MIFFEIFHATVMVQYTVLNYRVNQRTFMRFGCGVKIMSQIFESKMLTFHSKANLDEKIMSGKSHILKTK